ncbi:MAG: serine hydrolase [Euryarchaeota archaeon]|nr:serine hydrolase [Euryarchaeota archaeon]
MNKKLIAIVIVVLFIGIGFSSISQASIKCDKNILLLEHNEGLNEILFDEYITLLMKIAHKPSIAAGIIINDTLVWSKGYGLYDIEKSKQTTKDILYLQASVSKTVTSTALMQLYDEGLFGLDDDVNNYLPFLLRNPNYPDIPITIKMLLSHRSSLADDNLYWLCLSYLPGDPDVSDWPCPWLKEYLTPNGSAYSPTIWSKDKPGEKYYYANVGYSLIGYLVEILSGQNFNDYCKEHIFTPLHMYNTSFRLRDQNISNIAVPYEFKNGKYRPHPQYGMYVIHPAASMRTSVEDYSHFIIAHMNGGVWNGTRILNESTVELMHKAHFSPNDKNNYGLGWQITIKPFGKIEISHSGGWPGVHTMVTNSIIIS